MPSKKEPAKPTGRFAMCPASYINHEGMVFNEVMLSAKGTYFTFCGKDHCMTRVFFNTWGEGFGWTLEQVELNWGAHAEISPHRRAEIESTAARQRQRKRKAKR